MPDINPSLPIVGQPDSTEEPKIVTALSQLIAAVNNVDSAQIADGTITLADMAAGSSGLLQGSFLAYRNAGLTLAVNTALLFDTESYDTSSWYDPSTGKFTPQVAGVYRFTAQVQFTGPSDGFWAYLKLMKGATEVADGQPVDRNSAASLTTIAATLDIPLAANGSTDAFSIQVVTSANTSIALVVGGAPIVTWFSAELVGKS